MDAKSQKHPLVSNNEALSAKITGQLVRCDPGNMFASNPEITPITFKVINKTTQQSPDRGIAENL